MIINQTRVNAHCVKHVEIASLTPLHVILPQDLGIPALNRILGGRFGPCRRVHYKAQGVVNWCGRSEDKIHFK